MIYTRSKPLKRARNLRHNQTEAERRLWGYVRDKRLQGHKLNRQVPIGPYIADFLCFEAKLIIEIDGATHGEAHEVAYDEKRTVFLNAQGYRVMRCTNLDIFENLTGVLDTILLALESGCDCCCATALIRPSGTFPQRGKGGASVGTLK